MQLITLLTIELIKTNITRLFSEVILKKYKYFFNLVVFYKSKTTLFYIREKLIIEGGVNSEN